MTESLHRTVRVQCSIAHAFETFTMRIDLWWPQGHRRFEDSTLHLETFAGGRFFERSATGEEAKLGDLIDCEPPHRISFTWYPGAIDEPTRVDVSFTEEGAETVVRVVHSQAESALGDQWPERVELFTRGWESVLAALREHIVETEKRRR